MVLVKNQWVKQQRLHFGKGAYRKDEVAMRLKSVENKCNQNVLYIINVGDYQGTNFIKNILFLLFMEKLIGLNITRRTPEYTFVNVFTEVTCHPSES